MLMRPLLEPVIKAYGCDSKNEAIDFGLREMDRKVRFREVVKAGMGMPPEELADAVDPNYDIPATRVAETPSKYNS